MVLRCAAKTNTLPSTRRHHVLSNDLQGLVWDMDADTLLGRALHATRPCVAKRRPAREFAAAKTTSNLPMAAATKARLYTRRVPGPGSSLCAKTRARLYTRGMPGPGPSLSSSTCPTLPLRWRQARAHKRNLPREMGAGTTSFHFKRHFRPRSMLRRPSETTASRSRKTVYSLPKPFSKSRFVLGISAGLKSRVFQKMRAKSKGSGLSQSPPFFLSSHKIRIPDAEAAIKLDGRRERPRAPTPAAVRPQQTGTARPHPARRPPAGHIP